jgi:hypothetical protein
VLIDAKLSTSGDILQAKEKYRTVDSSLYGIKDEQGFLTVKFKSVRAKKKKKTNKRFELFLTMFILFMKQSHDTFFHKVFDGDFSGDQFFDPREFS